MEGSHLKAKILSSRTYPEFFPFNPNDRVVNIGCGEGPQAIVYAGQYKEMVGVDINKERLVNSMEAIRVYGIQNYTTLCANVEKIPLRDGIFDKAIAIDIIEHVQEPRKLCLKVNKLLKENGELLITFPVMYEKFRNFVSKVGHFILRRKKKREESTVWNPDVHNHKYPVNEWITIVENCGFKLHKSRAITLFPPLYLYGIPRFWFRSNVSYRIDSFFCKLPVIKNYGQTLLCVFKKE